MKGKIWKIEEGVVLIAPENTGCFGCMEMECHGRSALVRAENPLGLPLEMGQMVEADIGKRAIIRQACAALLPLAAGFAAGYALIGAAFPSSTDGARAAAGAALMFFAGIAVYTVRKRRGSRNKDTVTLTRILD